MSEEQPAVLGELTVGEMRAIESFRSAAGDVVREIGALEVRKFRLFGQLEEIEARAQNALSEAAGRLGIPAGQTWEVTPDGKVRRTA